MAIPYFSLIISFCSWLKVNLLSNSSTVVLPSSIASKALLNLSKSIIGNSSLISCLGSGVTSAHDSHRSRICLPVSSVITSGSFQSNNPVLSLLALAK
jgi:hypothetical protein